MGELRISIPSRITSEERQAWGQLQRWLVYEIPSLSADETVTGRWTFADGLKTDNIYEATTNAGVTFTGDILLQTYGIGRDNPVLTFAAGAVGEATFAGAVDVTGIIYARDTSTGIDLGSGSGQIYGNPGDVYISASGSIHTSGTSILLEAGGIGNNASVLTFATGSSGLATFGGAISAAGLSLTGNLDMGTNDITNAGNVYVNTGGVTGISGGVGWTYTTATTQITATGGDVMMPDASRTYYEAVGSTKDTESIWSSANGVLNFAAGGSFVSTGPDVTTNTNTWEWYSGSTLRSEFRAIGIQKWYLNNTAGEVGSIAYSTPSGVPGIIFADAAGASRSDVILKAGGGWQFKSSTTSSAGAVQFDMDSDGTILFVNPNVDTWSFRMAATADRIWYHFNQNTGDRLIMQLNEQTSSATRLTANYQFDQLTLGTSAAVGNQFIISHQDHYLLDFGHTSQTNPTLFGHSSNSPATNPTEWWSITHDQTNAVYSVGTGLHNFVGDMLSSTTGKHMFSDANKYINFSTDFNFVTDSGAFKFAGGTLTTTHGRVVNTTPITSGPYAILTSDHTIPCDTDGGAFEVDLPAGVEGTEYEIANTGTSGNDLTIDPNGSEQIAGGGAGVALDLVDGESVTIFYNATKGWIAS